MAGSPKQITTSGSSAPDLRLAWRDRLKDARVLLEAGHPASSIAAGLYALEIYLKVLICKRLRLDALPKAFEFHDLEGLLVLTGLQKRFDAEPTNGKFRQSWNYAIVLAEGLNDLRYLPQKNRTRAEAKTFLDQLTDPQDGILTWLKNQR